MSILPRALELFEKYHGKVVYRMGADLDGSPMGCDCSAFVARCCGQRKFDGRLWWNTDRIYADAKQGHVRWREIENPVPGCIGVYPGTTFKGKRVAGHVWVVADTSTAQTVECSSSGKGIAKQQRGKWFQMGAQANGKPIVWAEFVGGDQ
jgi:hypothetical protein